MILNLLKPPKGNEMEPSKEQCSINVVKSEKPAFSSIILPSFHLKSLSTFSNKFILFFKRCHFLIVLLLELATTSQHTEGTPQNVVRLCLGEKY